MVYNLLFSDIHPIVVRVVINLCLYVSVVIGGGRGKPQCHMMLLYF